MSADNWAICPKCKGHLREDYEIGMRDDGVFSVSYRSSCYGKDREGCGFTYRFKHDDIVYNESDKP